MTLSPMARKYETRKRRNIHTLPRILTPVKRRRGLHEIILNELPHPAASDHFFILDGLCWLIPILQRKTR